MNIFLPDYAFPEIDITVFVEEQISNRLCQFHRNMPREARCAWTMCLVGPYKYVLDGAW